MMFTVSAPDLTELAIGQASVLSMRAIEFSHDGLYLLVETTFSDDAAPELLRKAVSLYDCTQQSHLRVYNGLLGAGEAVDIQAAALAMVDGQARVALAFGVQGEDQGLANRVAWVIDDVVESFDLVEQISGERANAAIETLALTQNGQFLALSTAANNLVSPTDLGLDTNEVADVYGLNLQSQSLERISALADGTESTDPSVLGDARQLADGQVVVSFSSSGSDLAARDANAVDDVFLWSRSPSEATGSLELLSRNGLGSSASGASTASVITDAGVIFQSVASDLVTGDGNATHDVFLKPWSSESLARVTQQSLQDGGLLEYDADITLGGSSVDGRWLVWTSDAAALGAESGISQVFLQDRQLGTTVAVSALTVAMPGEAPPVTLGDESSFNPVLSDNGRFLAFSTLASNLGDSESGSETGVRLMVSAAAQVNSAPVGQVTITGKAERGQTLVAMNTLSDRDGIPSTGAGRLTYQWMVDGSPIEGATGDRLILEQAQVGRLITVKASYTDSFGTQEIVESAAVGAVKGLIEGRVYHWKSHALLSDVQVQSPSNNDTSSSVASSSDGAYTVGSVPVQGVVLSAARGVSDSGNAVSSADALAALRIAVGLNPNPDPDGAGPALAPRISPYQLIAADVNEDGRVTSADALAILRMAVKLNTAVAQEWWFVEERRDFWDGTPDSPVPKLTRTASGWDTAIPALPTADPVNLVGGLKGDVNGTWSAPSGSIDLDLIDPGYFQQLAINLGAPIDQWGI